MLCRAVCGLHYVKLQMRVPYLTTAVFSTLATAASTAAAAPFDGKWELDLRTPQEVRARAECGAAGFQLAQRGNKISGSHWFYTTGCGRMNEGGDETVVGEVHGRSATLTVTSSRNGAVVLGRAQLEGTSLRWQVLKELKPGEPEGDSPLILNRGLLKRVKGE